MWLCAESLSDTVLQLQIRLVHLDNCNRRNKIRVRGIPETVVDLQAAVKGIFHSLLSDHAEAAFTSDRIHRALQLKLPPEKTPNTKKRDKVMCLKDFLTKEDILRASRNTPLIQYEGTTIQI